MVIILNNIGYKYANLGYKYVNLGYKSLTSYTCLVNFVKSGTYIIRCVKCNYRLIQVTLIYDNHYYYLSK